MSNLSWRRIGAKRIGLAVCFALVAAGFAIGSPWLWVLEDLLRRVSRRQLAIIYLDGLLLGYALALAAAVVSIVGVVFMQLGARCGASARGAQARLLAFGVSVLLSLLALDGGAAAWSAWRERSPSLPRLTAQAG